MPPKLRSAKSSKNLSKTTRKRTKKNGDAELVDMDSNYSADQQTDELTNKSEPYKAKLVKSSKLKDTSRLAQKDQPVVVFSEEEDVFEMKVDSQDAISDGELVSNHGEGYDEASETDPSDSDPSNTETESDSDHDQTNGTIDQSFASSTQTTPKKKAKKHQSVEDKLDNLSSKLLQMHEMMKRKGLMDDDSAEQPQAKKKKARRNKDQGQPRSDKQGNDNDTNEGATCVSNSEMTVYDNAVQYMAQDTANEIVNDDQETEVFLNLSKRNRESSSSDEPIDTSDEMMIIDYNNHIIVDKA